MCYLFSSMSGDKWNGMPIPAIAFCGVKMCANV